MTSLQNPDYSESSYPVVNYSLSTFNASRVFSKYYLPILCKFAKMGSNEIALQKTVPIIDLAKSIGQCANEINIHSPAVSKIVKEIRNACIQWGFFYVVGHGIYASLIEELKNVAREFFHKPKEVKKSVQREPNNYRGYTDHELTKQSLDFKEAFDYGVEFPAEVNAIENGIDLDAGKNQWPEDMQNFKETLLKYFSEMHSLSTTIMELIFMSLNTDPKSMRHHFNESSDTSFCRLNYYPRYEATQSNQLGVGPHSDAGVLTVLLQDDNVSSLQVEKDGVFHDVSPIEGSFVINIGDMMQVWSNGLFKAPVHRVLTNSGKERFSVPFFYNPAYECNVAPLPQCVSNDQPCRYLPINWGVFRQGRIKGDYADHGEEIQIHHFEIKN